MGSVYKTPTCSGLKLDWMYLRPQYRIPREDTKCHFVWRHTFIFEHLQMLESWTQINKVAGFYLFS